MTDDSGKNHADLIKAQLDLVRKIQADNTGWSKVIFSVLET